MENIQVVPINVSEEAASFASPFVKRQGRTLTWNSLSFAAKKGNKEPKIILDGISGEVTPGQVCCILGPSGAGKSSLLNVLCGRIAQGGNHEISGTISVNGSAVNPSSLSFKQSVAYVMQEDATWPTLTCREALRVAATLRLPASVSESTKDNLVNTIIKELGLTECADVLCGGPLVKGLSGGEKKRVCIGLELISNPTLIFLDEPTSGLDSYSAKNCVELLRKISRAGSSVLCTIHQPSSEVFQLFDRCILMKSGRIVFQGPTEEINTHFEKIGFPVPMNYNPADHAMSVVQRTSIPELEAKNAFTAAASTATERRATQSKPAPYHSTAIRASFWKQLSILCWRELMNVRRDPGVLIGRFGVSGMINGIMACVFFGSGRQNDMEPENLQNHFGALSFAMISAMFGNAQGTLLTFPFEKPVFLREYSTGMYSATAYCLSKIIAEIPLVILQCCWSVSILYWMLGWQGKFLGIVVAQVLLGLASSSIAMVLGASVNDTKTAAELMPAVLVPQIMFAGFFVRVDQIPIYLRWAQYLCSLKFGVNLAVIVEFGSSTCAAENPGCKRLLDTNDIVEEDWWIYVLVLFSLFFFFRLMAINVLVTKSRKFY
jgi:ABC-type multidrug transport system ATPase subunit